MDTNHPIPQDVTGFQFRLIGNMTVKQFAYIAVGGILAVLTYYAPIFFLFKVFFIPLFGGVGLALAFLPIEGRPLDLMLSKFIKDLLSPTQYVYQKTGGALALSTLQLDQPHQKKHDAKKKGLKNQAKQTQIANFLSGLTTHKNILDEKEDMYLNSLFSSASTQIISMEEELRKSAGIELTPFELTGGKGNGAPGNENSQLEREARAIKEELAKAREQEAALANTNQPVEKTHEHVNDLEKQLNDIMAQKEQLEHEILQFQEKAKEPKKAATVPPPPTGTMNVHAIPIDQATLIGLPSIPDVPNIIIGIIKDSRGNVLPNILVEIKDKEDNPVRAFKTNGLGQFASATQLAVGDYSIHFEDPKGNHKFDTISIQANNTIMLPLEIISVDAREVLRKELFN